MLFPYRWLIFMNRAFFPYLAATWAGAMLGNPLGYVFFSLTATSIGHLSLSSMVSLTFHDSTFFSLFFPYSVCDGIILLTVDLGKRGKRSSKCCMSALWLANEFLCAAAQSHGIWWAGRVDDRFRVGAGAMEQTCGIQVHVTTHRSLIPYLSNSRDWPWLATSHLFPTLLLLWSCSTLVHILVLVCAIED